MSDTQLEGNSEMTEVNLGDKVRDLVSGFEGIAVCKAEWLNGCVRWTLSGRVGADGKEGVDACFDSQQLEVTEENAIGMGPQDVAGVAQVSATGGPTSSNPAQW